MRGGTAAPPAPTVAPKMAARRAAVAQARTRRRGRRIGALVAGLALVGGSVWVSQSFLADVDRIEVVGARHHHADTIREASGVAIGDALVALDVPGAIAGVEGLPWIEEAVVERRWPTHVVIEVTERRAVAALAASDGAWVLVDDDGVALERRRSPGPLPQVQGVQASVALGAPVPEGARAPIDLAAAAPRELRGDLGPLEVRDGEVWVELRGGGQARFGDGEDASDKVAALQTLIERVDLRCLEVADLRVPSAPTLTRFADCE